MSEKSVYLVLEDYVGYNDFLDVAKIYNWSKYKTYPGDGERKHFEEVWATPDRSNAIHYIDDPITLTKHLWIRGAQLNEVLFLLGALPCYEDEELLQAAVNAEEHDEAIRALFRIAVAFPNYDPDAYKIFSAYLTHPDALLREATVQAIGYRMWPESRKLLEEVVRQDPSESVRQFAQTILDKTKEENRPF